jgi:hypothetical protein
MGSPKTPKAPPPPPPPAEMIDAEFAGRAEKKRLRERKGGLATWLTRGQKGGKLGTGSKLV